jgi:hypothetical protein
MDELRQQFEAAFPQPGGAIVAQPRHTKNQDWMGMGLQSLKLFGIGFIAAIPMAFLYVQFGQTHSDTNVRRNAQSTVEVQPDRTNSAL